MVYSNMSRKEILEYMDMLELKLKDLGPEVSHEIDNALDALIEHVSKHNKGKGAQ